MKLSLGNCIIAQKSDNTEFVLSKSVFVGLFMVLSGDVVKIKTPHFPNVSIHCTASRPVCI